MPDENHERSENCGPISLMNKRKFLKKTLANQILEKVIPRDQGEHSPVTQAQVDSNSFAHFTTFTH